MEHSQGYLEPEQEIFYQYWRPDDPPKAVLLFAHGLAEHSGRYMNLVNYFVPRGFSVYGLDHTGHGRSRGHRLYVDRFEAFTAALGRYHAMIRTMEPDLPVILVGHSMGGLIAAVYLLDHQDSLAGAVLSGPAAMIPDSVSKAALALGRLLSGLLPKMRVMGLDANGVSRDPEVVKAYLEDPLVCKEKVTARLSAELTRAVRRLGHDCSRISLPLMVLQGGADTIVDPAGSRMLFERARSLKKRFRLYDGLFHEVFNEPEREQVLGDMAQWLDDILPGSH